MRKTMILLMAATMIGCARPESNYPQAIAMLQQAEKAHPDKDFGMIEESPDNMEYLAMLAQGWSSYLTVDRYKGGGGWGWIILSRDKKSARKP